jgi:ribosome recycling factor
MQAVMKDAETRMNAALEALGREFATVRTGRASVGLLEAIRVDYYGTPTAITQMASVSTPDARTLAIQPWEAGQIGAIEKAIQKSDLGLTPVNDGKLIRLTLPTPTEERRKQLVKTVAKMAEDARVAVRNIRREANEKLKGTAKDKKVSEDEERRAHDQVQKATDRFIAKVDELFKKKEQEILSF